MSEEKRDPVKYTVLEKSLIGNEIFEAGTTCEYAGLPSENLAPQCEVGAARYQEYIESNKARVAAMISQNASVDEDSMAKAVAKAVSAGLVAAQAGQAEMIASAVAAALAQVFPNGTAKKAVDPTDKPLA